MTDQPTHNPDLVTVALLPPGFENDDVTLTVHAHDRELARITVHRSAIHTSTWSDRMPDLIADLVRDALRTG